MNSTEFSLMRSLFEMYRYGFSTQVKIYWPCTFIYQCLVRDSNWILYKMHNNKQTHKRKMISKSILTDWNTAFIFDVEHVINLYTITLIILRLPRLLQHTIILGIIITIRSSRTLQISWNPGWWLHDQAVIRETDTNIL